MGIKKINKVTKIDIKEGLKNVFPQVFEDNKINFGKLKSLLKNEIIVREDDRFYFNWAGKSNLFKLIQAPAYGTLKPDKKNSMDFDKTENLMIVGENLETLKLLLRPYFGKVKMIYIDPPYNTGRDFIYRDNFKEPLRDYLEKTGQISSEGEKLTTNTEASGRYHSDWLNFMYPRLFLARSLLRDDGVVFVSIDDNEVHNLRKIMDEIFGEENLVAMLPTIMNLKGNQDQFGFAGTHEYTLVFAKNKNLTSIGEFDVSEEELLEWDEDEYGYYKKGAELKATGTNAPREKRPNLFYPIFVTKENAIYVMENNKMPANRKNKGDVIVYPITDGKEMSWRWEKKKVREESYNLIVERTTNNSVRIYKKQRPSLGDLPSKKPKSIFYKPEYSSGNGTIQLKEIFGGRIFDNPKPLDLIKDMIKISTSKEDLILDFLAGSGTTGHAVWELNREDGGNRNFILVQLEEEVQSEEVKKEFKTVADICIERLKRVSKKYREDKTLFSQHQDLGFKVFRLDKSNFNLKDEFEMAKEKDAKELKKKYLEWLGMWVKEPLVPGWKPLDVVYESMLKEGFDLNSKIKEIKIKNNNFWHITDEKEAQEFFISLDEKINKTTIEEIRTAKYKNKLFVFLDKALTDNDKLNLKAFVRIKVI